MAKTIPNLLTVPETQRLLGARLKALRLRAGYKRTTLASRSAVSLASLKRFEATGEVSLKSLLRLAQALDRLVEFSALFIPPEAATLAELETHARLTRRGRI